MAWQTVQRLLFDANRAIQDVRNLPSAALVGPRAIRISGRRGLISRRRLGQGVPGRLVLELGLLVEMGAHQGIPVEDTLVFELSWAHRAANGGLLDRAGRLRGIGDARRARIDA